jgi:hypothetical protein
MKNRLFKLLSTQCRQKFVVWTCAEFTDYLRIACIEHDQIHIDSKTIRSAKQLFCPQLHKNQLQAFAKEKCQAEYGEFDLCSEVTNPSFKKQFDVKMDTYIDGLEGTVNILKDC